MLSVLFLLVLAAMHAQEFNPRINVNEGQVFNYRVEAETESVQSAMGQEISSTASQKATIVDSVRNVFDDGSMEILARFRDVSVRATVMGRDTVLTYQGLIGAPTLITLDSQGKIISREIMDEAMEQNTALPELDNGLLGQNLFTQLPDHPLKPGDQWTTESLDSIEQASFGGVIVVSSKGDYTLGSQVAFEGNTVWEVNFSTVMEITGEGSMQGMNVTMEGSGIAKGMIYIDPAAYMIVHQKSEVENDLTVAISGPQSLIMPISQKSVVTFTLEE